MAPYKGSGVPEPDPQHFCIIISATDIVPYGWNAIISTSFVLQCSASICSLLQYRVLKLDELGEKAKTLRDFISYSDRRGKNYEKAIDDYVKSRAGQSYIEN